MNYLLKKQKLITMKKLFILFICLILIQCQKSNTEKTSTRWSQEKANQWGNNLPWLRGSNFNPSTSINQLKFWQKETFDSETIE
jgi:Tfp pilus assembly protein PilV